MSLDSKNKFSWIELAALLPEGGMVRNQFVSVDDVTAISTWRDRFTNKDVYASICSFTEPSRESRYVCPFYLDIDCENQLERAFSETLGACNLLIEHIGIGPDCLDIYFSGAKGFHVIVPLEVFGQPTYHNIMAIWLGLAKRLAKEDIKHIDLAVYQSSRVLRLPNSINSKTGLYKVPLEFKELRDLGLGYVLEIARSPREEDSMAMPEESPRAMGWLNRAMDLVQVRKNPCKHDGDYKFRNGWRKPPSIRRLETETLPNGIRHTAYFELSRFYAWINMHPLVDRVRGYVTDSIWIGKANQLRQRTAWKLPGDHPEILRLLSWQTKEKILEIYEMFRNDWLIKWKDSYKKVIGLDRPDEAGLDI